MKRLGFILLSVLALGLTACSGTPNRVQEVQVETTEFKFSPATIQVEAGRPVKLTLVNKGSVEHDFSVSDILLTDVKTLADSHGHDMGSMAVQPKLHVAAGAAQSSVIEFTPTRPGTYEVFCTVAGHKEAGMITRLVVK